MSAGTNMLLSSWLDCTHCRHVVAWTETQQWLQHLPVAPVCHIHWLSACGHRNSWMSYCACVLQSVYCSMPQLVTSQLCLKTAGMSNSLLLALLLLTFLCLPIPCAASLFQSHQIQSVCSHPHGNLSSHRPQSLRVIALLPSILGNSMNGIHVPLLPCSLTCLTSATLSKPQSQKSLSCEK